MCVFFLPLGHNTRIYTVRIITTNEGSIWVYRISKIQSFVSLPHFQVPQNDLTKIYRYNIISTKISCKILFLECFRFFQPKHNNLKDYPKNKSHFSHKDNFGLCRPGHRSSGSCRLCPEGKCSILLHFPPVQCSHYSLCSHRLSLK